MNLQPDPAWPSILLALALLGDAALSIWPPKFIRDCLDGVRLPRDWWWVLIVVKTLAAIGLLVGLNHDGIGLAANAGVVAYFLCAVVAHVRARFFGSAFWVNCLGMLALATGCLVWSFGPL